MTLFSEQLQAAQKPPLNSIFAQNPVWPNCPPICKATMLPAFETEKDMVAWMEAKGTNPDKGATGASQCSIIKKFECKVCNNWHALTITKGPGANSASGKDRISLFLEDSEKLIQKFQRFFKVSEEMKTGQNERKVV